MCKRQTYSSLEVPTNRDFVHITGWFPRDGTNGRFDSAVGSASDDPRGRIGSGSVAPREGLTAEEIPGVRHRAD